MSDPNIDMTTGVERGSEESGRHTPASSVCYLDLVGSRPAREAHVNPNNGISEDAANEESTAAFAAAVMLPGEESDITPRSEVPSAVDMTGAHDPLEPDQQNQAGPPPEQGYFSPQPLRFYSTRLPTTTSSSADPSPTPSLNASTASVHIPHGSVESLEASEHQDRPSVQRDLSSTSTASVATVRAASTDPLSQYSTPLRSHRDGPHYPNQSYAALQSQHYPPPYSPHILRTRSSHPSHYTSRSVAEINTFGMASEQHRDIMESGSRTVGNSPASSPGLFSPQTPPLRHSQRTPEDQGYYSSPYLHYTHRQAPKETHVADIELDPISGRKIINQYEIIDELGRGVHGKVKLGRNLETGVHVAIKIVDRYSKRRRLGKNTSHEDKIRKEIAILKKARHHNIVSLLEVIDDPSRKKVYIVLEHVELGEVKWRIEGAKEVAFVEWRRYQRESEGVFDNDAATIEDEKIIALAHQRLEKRERRRLKELHDRRMQDPGIESWSFEHGGDSEEEESESRRDSQASASHYEEPPESPKTSDDRHQDRSEHEDESTMDTLRTHTPTSSRQESQLALLTALEGTMYGAYDTEVARGRTPSLAGSSSSRYTDPHELSEIPEHFRYVPLMTLEAARDAFRDTVLGLEYLHYQGVIHRDIKPANLLQTKEHKIKISDFGVSYLGRQSSEDNAEDQSESDIQDADEAIELAKTVGTPAFYAPELCRTDLEDTPPVTGKIDVWALGVTLYCLVFGRVPFHENNTFFLMRVITDTEPYIPRYRLKAVAEKADSRPNSHGRFHHPMTSNKRAPHDLEYEHVDDDLYDLLRRLLIKDARKRITLKEIKHHPWLLQGIDNKVAWMEETDPTRTTQGRRIEVSKDEVEKAVVPITLIDRVRSGVRKTLNTVMSLGNRGASRRRAQSSATNPDQSGGLSAASSSSTISQDGRRPSLGVNESIFAALKQSREGEHPLSQSVTASPEARDRARYFDGSNSRSQSPAHHAESNEHPAPLMGSSRPFPPERAFSTMSTATSIRTIRQSDMQGSAQPSSPTFPPALPGTPTALDSPGGSNLGGIFGGVPRRLVNSVRSRERGLKPQYDHGRAKSIDRLVGADDDAHGGPSIALSNAIAAGHVDQPDLLKDISPPVGPASVSSADYLYPEPIARTSSRQSSISSASSRPNPVYVGHDDYEVGPRQYLLRRESYDERFIKAKEELMKQRVDQSKRAETKQGRDRPRSMTYARPPSAMSETACPPSPDDDVFFARQRLDDLFNQQHPGHAPVAESGPLHYPMNVNHQPSRALTSSSSEDHFTSMSQSTSNPSIPSVISANSSVAPEDSCVGMEILHEMPRSSEDTLGPSNVSTDDFSGYDGDHALESGDDQEDDSDSDDDFIVMTKKKSRTQGLSRSESVSNAELQRHGIRREISSARRRSTRSGSNGTVKKIRPVGETEDESRSHREGSSETA